jgi:hypothetical protein
MKLRRMRWVDTTAEEGEEHRNFVRKCEVMSVVERNRPT